MVVFDLDVNANGRIYLPAPIRNKACSKMKGVMQNGILVVVNADQVLDKELMQRSLKLAVEELILDQDAKSATKA